jgi:hypothetical protein
MVWLNRAFHVRVVSEYCHPFGVTEETGLKERANWTVGFGLVRALKAAEMIGGAFVVGQESSQEFWIE